MNTRPDATTILCYGDSNTWGQKPDKSGRYPANVRWTGKLQDKIGDDYYVIEEGLNSRTTDLEYNKRPGRNGKEYLLPCISSHNPLDVVIIMLGTNDLKTVFDRNAIGIAEALRGLVQNVKENARNKNGNTPKIILTSPILIDDTAPLFSRFYTENFGHEAVVKSQNLANEVVRIAEETGCIFLDASTVAQPGEDGLHLNEESHATLAALVADTVQNAL
jgi:lysophospholipase L1-like esterase